MILVDIGGVQSGISIASLARELNLSRQTIYNYREIADYLLDFETDYPNFDGRTIKEGVGLTEYQAWVISLLISIRRMRRLTMQLLEEYIQNPANHFDFSKQTFINYKQENETNECSTIRTEPTTVREANRSEMQTTIWKSTV